MDARSSILLIAGVALAINASTPDAAAQQSTGAAPSTSSGPGVRTTTGPRPGSRLPPARPAAARPSAPSPAPVYNPNVPLEQRQNQLRNIALANPGDRYTRFNVQQALADSALETGGQRFHGGFTRSFSFTVPPSQRHVPPMTWPRRPVSDFSFRPQTVNDFIYAIEFLESGNWGCGGSPSLAEGGNRLSGGFLAEPFEPSSVFPGVNPAVFASMTAAPPAEPPTAAELGNEALMAGRPADAVTAYKAHLDTQSADSPTLVRMAIAMIESGSAADGVAVLMKAYRDDPTIASISLRPMTETWEPSRTRALVTKAVTHANRDGGASAWATVAVLMVADGREALAAQMLDRSIAAGLDPELGTRLSAMIAEARK